MIGYDICGLEYLSSLLNLFVLKILLKWIKNLKSLFADTVTRLLSYDELSFFSIEIFLYSIIFFSRIRRKTKKIRRKTKRRRKEMKMRKKKKKKRRKRKQMKKRRRKQKEERRRTRRKVECAVI